MSDKIDKIRTLSRLALIKWKDDSRRVDEPCAFCDQCSMRCDCCLCPRILCGIDDTGLVSVIADNVCDKYPGDADAYIIKNVDKHLVDMMTEALRDLSKFGTISDVIKVEIQKILEHHETKPFLDNQKQKMKELWDNDDDDDYELELME